MDVPNSTSVNTSAEQMPAEMPTKMDLPNSMFVNTSEEQMPAEMPRKISENTRYFRSRDDNDIWSGVVRERRNSVSENTRYFRSRDDNDIWSGVVREPRNSQWRVQYINFEEERKEQSKKVNEEAARIKCEKDKLLKKPDTDPQVTEATEFMEIMTEEILDQKLRLTQSRCKVTGKGKTDNASPKPPLFDTAQLDVRDEETSTYDTGVAQCKVRTSSGSVREVCSEVKIYLKQVTRLVQQKIQGLPEYVHDQLEIMIQSFQRLIAGMWKLLLLELLCYELVNLLTSFSSEHTNISKKKGRLKYGFKMAAMLVLWLSHDVESNPGPQFSVRWCLERITRQLSEVLKDELPVDGTLWSETVAEAAYAAGYSPDCQWTNPSGNSKDKLTPLIERATELARVLTEMDCLPHEFEPFINDLGNYKVQEQLVDHYKLEHYKTAVDILLGVSSFSDAHKQDIIRLTKTLQKKVSENSGSTHKQVLNDSCLPLADFGKLADTSGTQTVAIKMQSKKQRGPKRKLNRRPNRTQVKQLQNSDMSTSTASDASGQSACKPVVHISDMLLYDIDVNEGSGGLLKWLDNKEEEEVESRNVSKEVITSPGAHLSQAIDLQTQSPSSDPVTAHEESQPWQNEPYTDGDDSRITVGNKPEDILCTDTLTLSRDIPMSYSDTQTWTAEMGQINHSEQSQKTGETMEILHPRYTEQDIIELLDLLPNQDSPTPPNIPACTVVAPSCMTEGILLKYNVAGCKTADNNKGQGIESSSGDYKLSGRNNGEKKGNVSYPVSSVAEIAQPKDPFTPFFSQNDTSVTKPILEESTTESVMETSLYQTATTKQSTPECDTEVDVRSSGDLYPLRNHSTTETENVASEELEISVNTYVPHIPTDQQREITLDKHETITIPGNHATLGRDRCISTVYDVYNGHADILVRTYSVEDISNTRDTDVECAQAMDNSQTTPDTAIEQSNIGDSNDTLHHVRQELSAKESHSTKQDSDKSGYREDNKAANNETTTKDPKVTSMTPSCTMEPSRVEDSQFEEFKASTLKGIEKDIESRWEAFKAAQETNTPNGHVESNNEHGQTESHAQNRKRRLSKTEYPVKRRK